MVAGHLREQNGYYQIILSYKDYTGKRRTKSISTGLPVKGNKRRAEAMLIEARKTFEPLDSTDVGKKSPLFTDFMRDWLRMMKNSVEITTYGGYSRIVENKIIPYFSAKGILLSELGPKDIQDYYSYCLNTEGLSPNTVIHIHATSAKHFSMHSKRGLSTSIQQTELSARRRMITPPISMTGTSWPSSLKRPRGQSSNWQSSSAHSTD